MGEQVAIIDYGSGNLRSVEKALERAALEAGVAASIAVTDHPEKIANADRIVLPGVGAFGACMAGLSGREGVLEALEHAVLVMGKPFLGICVGMQLIAGRSAELGDHPGLGWIAGEVLPIDTMGGAVCVPHMGWNEVKVRTPHPLFEGAQNEYFVFMHSFSFVAENKPHVVGIAHHGQWLTAAVARDNIAGVQFHPEKSLSAGILVLRNFLSWDPLAAC
jgi:glutamine amidotransferase